MTDFMKKYRDVILYLLAVAFVCLLTVKQDRDWTEQDKFYLQEFNTKVLVEMDGYYYLNIARAYSKSHDDQPFFLLPAITAWLSGATHLALEKVAFYLPSILSIFLGVPLLLWSRKLGGTLFAITALSCGILSFCWVITTNIGSYDTDVLIPTLLLLGAYFLSAFCQASTRHRFVFLALFVLTGIVYYFWWKPGLIVFMLFLPIYSFSFFLPASNVEKRIKIALCAGQLCIPLLYSIGFMAGKRLPGDAFIRSVFSHLRLVMKKNANFFPDVGQTIAELNPPSVSDFIDLTFSTPLGLALALVGLVLLFRRVFRPMWFLLPILVIGAFSCIALRFLVILFPLLAFGVAESIVFLTQDNRYARKLPAPLRTLAFLAILAVVIIPQAIHAVQYAPHHARRILPGHIYLAESIARQKKEAAVVWSWWDYGYYLEYATGKEAFIDGGTQDPLRTFVCAYPLTSRDPVEARHWMKFFAHHGPKGFLTIRKAFALTDQETIAFLSRVFKNRHLTGSLPAPARPHEIDSSAQGLEGYLFPEATVYLYLPFDLLKYSRAWSYFGHFYELNIPYDDYPGIVAFYPKKATQFDPAHGRMRTELGSHDLERYVKIANRKGYVEKFPNSLSHNTLVDIDNHPDFIVLLDNADDLVINRLLFPTSPVPGFRVIVNQPGVGGVWEVN